eukprot:10105028-Ditylum_brightwellii.AAC.1
MKPAIVITVVKKVVRLKAIFPPNVLTLASHTLKVATVVEDMVEEEVIVVEAAIRILRINLGLPNQESHM